MPAGAPSKYDPAMCEEIITLGEQGKSVTYMAGKLGICRQTLENWSGEHPEFLDAFNRAKVLSQMWWEDKGQSGVEKAPSEFQGNLWGRNMSARFPADWREKQLIGSDPENPLPEGFHVNLVGRKPVGGDE